MITLFNRKELIVTYDMNKLNEVRTILNDHGIEHIVKVANTMAPSVFSSRSRVRRSNIGIDLSKNYE